MYTFGTTWQTDQQMFVFFQFMAGTQVDMEQVHMSIRPLLLKLGDYRSLNLQLIQVR